MEPDAELGEEDTANIAEQDKACQGIVEVIDHYACNTFNTHLYNIQVEDGIQSTFSSIQQIFMKRIMTISSEPLCSNSLNLLQNVCYNHNLVLIDVPSLVQKQIDNELSLLPKIQKEHKMR